MPVIIWSFICLLGSRVLAQPLPEKIRQALTLHDNLETTGVTRPYEVKEFYAFNYYSPAWLTSQGTLNRISLIKLLQSSGRRGLNETDYQYDFIGALPDRSLPLSSKDSLVAELKFTDAAIHFFSDLAYGNIKPALGFDGLGYAPKCYNIARLVAEYCTGNRLDSLADSLATLLPEIKAIGEKLERMQMAINSKIYKEEKITSTVVNHLNKPLVKKLYAMGIADSAVKLSDKDVKENLKEAQRQLNLLADGVLRSTALAELNIPLEKRIVQLKLALNYYRWLYCLSKTEKVIVVNIPATNLKVYGPDSVVLVMKMVVGHPSTPTPTLISQISEVILYPYWMVPHSIATKELLPSIKKNPGFINANNFQVITPEGKIADPSEINWALLNASNFPYTIRQSTGCDNALGIIKLNFYNPFSVYLHDTPHKSLFSLNRRYFSHGCMRMEKPFELARLVLKNNTAAIDTLDASCLLNQKPIVIPADEKLKVVVWYNPAGIDTSGRVIFYEDVYKKFR